MRTTSDTMTFPLHTTKKLPPKGWVYRELIAGKWWVNRDPMRGFDHVSEGLFNARTNNKVKTTKRECDQSIAVFTCNRLGGDSRWCVGESDPVAVAKSANERKCKGCGAKRKK